MIFSTGQFATPADYYRSARTELEASKNAISAEGDRLKATAGKKGAADLRRQISAEANAHRNAYAGKLAEAEQTLGPRAAEQMRSDVEGTPAPQDKATPAPDQYHQFFNGIRRGDSIATPQGNFQVTKADAMLMQPVMPTGRQWGAIGGAQREVLSVTGHLEGEQPKKYDKRDLEELLYPKTAKPLPSQEGFPDFWNGLQLGDTIQGPDGNPLKVTRVSAIRKGAITPTRAGVVATPAGREVSEIELQSPGGKTQSYSDYEFKNEFYPAPAAAPTAQTQPTGAARTQPAQAIAPAPHEGDIVAFNGPGGETVGPQAGEGRIVKTYSDGTHEVRIPPKGAHPARSVWIKPGQVYSINGTVLNGLTAQPAAAAAASPAAAPQPPAPPAEPSQPTGAPGLVDAIYQKVKAGEPLGNITDLTKLAEQHFGSGRTSAPERTVNLDGRSGGPAEEVPKSLSEPSVFPFLNGPVHKGSPS